MTLITITLEENEQDWLLTLAEPADNYTPHPVTTSLAEKVRRAQDASPWESFMRKDSPEEIRRVNPDYGNPSLSEIRKESPEWKPGDALPPNAAERHMFRMRVQNELRK